MRLLTLLTILSFMLWETNPLFGQNVQPSVMVVPLKKKGESYRIIIEDNKFIRTAIGKMDEFFLSRDFRTVDFLQHYQTIKNDAIIEKPNQTSIEQRIAENTNAEIIVYIDAEYIVDGRDKFVNVTLKAIDSHTAQVMSSAEGASMHGSFDDPELYIKKAIESCAENFLNTMNTQFADILENGRPTKISITLHPESDYNFNSEINDDFDELTDILSDFFKNAAFKNYARCPIKVKTKFECDDFRIPIRDPENPNLPYDINDTFRSFRKFLGKNYKIYCTGGMIGGTLRITICGSKKCS